MKFRFLMLMLAWRLRWLGWRNPKFQEQIGDKELVMQWQTRDGRPARWFRFQGSRVCSAGGLHEQADVTLSFESAAYAFDTLLAAGKNQMIFMEGMQNGHIKIHGDASQLMWFMGLMKFIVPGKAPKKQG